MKRDHENLRRIIRASEFSQFEDEIMQYAKPSIRVYTEAVEDEAELPLGQSKIGGQPDLPRGMEWVKVQYDGLLYALQFIAQFNLADLTIHDKEMLLPRTGMLYFFASHYSLPGTSQYRVIYHVGDSYDLWRRPFPEGISYYDWGGQFKPCKIDFVSEVNLAQDCFIPLRRHKALTLANWKSHVELMRQADYRSHDPIRERHVNRLLGGQCYGPDQRTDCELIAQTGDIFYGITGISEEQQQQAEHHKSDWQLLFELSSDDNAGMQWNDDGSIFYYIRLEDLKRANFDNVCVRSFSP